jgi:hypothetical protein
MTLRRHGPRSIWEDRPNLEAQLRQLWTEGLSALLIAEALSERRAPVTKNMVVGKAHRLKLPGRPNPIKRKQQPTRKSSEPSRPPPVVAVPVVLSQALRCCFPLGEARPWRFCDEPATEGRSYCTEHHALTHQARRGPEREEASLR